MLLAQQLTIGFLFGGMNGPSAPVEQRELVIECKREAGIVVHAADGSRQPGAGM